MANKKPTIHSPRWLYAQIEAHKEGIAKHRDALRDLISEAESIAECGDRAIEALDNATDALSEYL